MFAYSRSWGLESAKASLSQALISQKFPHALLIHGPAGVGQNALVLDLVDLLICEAKVNRPCGQCAGCLGRKRNNLDSLIFIMPLEKKEKGDKGNADGDGPSTPTASGAQLDELAEKALEFHQDPYGFSRTEKSRINIAQVRDLQSRLSFTEVLTRPRIVVMLWAESMPQEAANALLKTLEEPPPNTYFLLTSDDRASLLPTILSRCTQIALFPLEPAAFSTLLIEKGKSLGMESVPDRLLPFAEGSLGVLLALHRNGGEGLLTEAQRFLDSALGGDWRAFSDYVEASPALAELESAAQLCHFLLRLIRLFHRLKIQGEALDLGLALSRLGFSAELAAYLKPLEKAPNLAALVNWIEEVLAAVQSYAKPKVAALGLYLEFEQKHLSKESKK